METSRQWRKCLAWLPAILIAGMIFWFSSQSADESTKTSDLVGRTLLWVLETAGIVEENPEEYQVLLEKLSWPIRKCAHITEFALLYTALLFALSVQGVRGQKQIYAALGMTVLYACTDEFHQLFVPGRAGLMTDVIIDSIGALVMTLVLSKKEKRKGCK